MRKTTCSACHIKGYRADNPDGTLQDGSSVPLDGTPILVASPEDSGALLCDDCYETRAARRAAARSLGSARTPAKAAAVRENGKKGGRPPATVHVTRVTNGDVYGHAARHCDPTGCAGDERYLGRIEDAEVGHVYEIRGGRVLAEIVE